MWVDIRARTMHRASWNRRRLEVTAAHTFEDEVSCGLPVAGRPRCFVVPCGRALVRYDEPELTTTIGVLEDDRRLQLNDAACDPSGRLWVGSFSKLGEPMAGSLFRVDLDGRITCQMRGVTTSNGIAWSPAGDRMYYVDSPTRRVDIFDYDLSGGRALDRRIFVDLSNFAGVPDGVAVDADGGVWVAMWDGNAVLRFAPDGTPTHRIDLPVSRPTAPCLGGADLATMFITTARVDLAGTELARQPDAGRVFSCVAPVGGLPATPYAGPLDKHSLMSRAVSGYRTYRR